MLSKQNGGSFTYWWTHSAWGEQREGLAPTMKMFHHWVAFWLKWRFYKVSCTQISLPTMTLTLLSILERLKRGPVEKGKQNSIFIEAKKKKKEWEINVPNKIVRWWFSHHPQFNSDFLIISVKSNMSTHGKHLL